MLYVNKKNKITLSCFLNRQESNNNYSTASIDRILSVEVQISTNLHFSST